jgi:hypothetical protein
MEASGGSRMTVRLVLGMFIIALGVLFTLDNLHVIVAGDFLRFWPVVFVAIGAARVAEARTPGRVVVGGLWILVGGALLGRQMGLLPRNILEYWPLVLVALGAYVVWQSLGRSGAADRGEGPLVSAVAILSGLNRKVTDDFHGAELTAIMGGGKLDLRDATLNSGKAVLDVFAMMGGFEILIPETWNVRNEVIPFMGGVDDKTRMNPGTAAPVIVIRGFVMWGGIDIKNWDKRDH